MRDTGIGLSSDDLPRMMEKLEHGMQTPARRSGGAGAIVDVA